ncbi:MAG: hypothetical protein H6Q18_937 [Bacteroidetes bacterium]|nr:hypothetical protein [Bacteroidota bacterium]
MQLQIIENKIYVLRSKQIMLDFDLAVMYGLETRTLKQTVKRNIERFPIDFMFQLSKQEWQELITICDKLPENIKFSPALPYAFTQEGVAMLSGVLRSPVAVQVNISIMRAFVIMRKYALSSTVTLNEVEELKQKIKVLIEDVESLNKDHEQYEEQFDDIYVALTQLAAKQEKTNKPRNPIGFDIEK